MDISLGRVLEAARVRRATLTPEVAGYVILLAAQQLAAERAWVSADSVLLDSTGDVLVLRGPAADEGDIEAALRGLLAALIRLCVSPPPAIGAVASRPTVGDLQGLVMELSAALIPINHAAAHRALARLYRETRRAEESLGNAALPPIADAALPPVADAALLPVADAALLPVAERRPDPHAGDLEIDVVVEPESGPDSPPVPVQVSEAQADREPGTTGVEPASGQPNLDEPTRPRLAMTSASLVAEDPPGGARVDEAFGLASPGPRRWSAEVRSDLHELLDAFLMDARSIDRMLSVLRDMLGFDSGAGCANVKASRGVVPR